MCVLEGDGDISDLRSEWSVDNQMMSNELMP